MIIQAIRGDNYTTAFDLICDTCGKRCVYEGKRSQCEKYIKINKWKKLGGNRHECRLCTLRGWKTIPLKK